MDRAIDTTPLDRVFIDYSIKKLRQLASRIEDCLERLDNQQIWRRATENENAIGNLVLHLCGNVRQWIVCGVGGEPDRRQRDAEFSARRGATAAELKAQLDQTMDAALHVLGSVDAARLLSTVTIQGYDVTVLECVYHVVEHFSNHTGQILFATKLLTGADLGYYAHLAGAGAHGQTTP